MKKFFLYKNKYINITYTVKLLCSIREELCSILDNIISCDFADNSDNVGLINEICINYKCIAIAHATLFPKYCLHLCIYVCN